MFNIGDRVRIVRLNTDGGYHNAKVGLTGVVMRTTSSLVGCEMDNENFQGHSLDELLPADSRRGYWLHYTMLELDGPISPFDAKVRAYINRELPHG